MALTSYGSESLGVYNSTQWPQSLQSATLAICPNEASAVSIAAHYQGSSPPLTKNVLVPFIPNPPNSVSVKESYGLTGIPGNIS